MARKTPAQLARARAYWRLAAKAERAGSHSMAEHYRRMAERAYAGYRRQADYLQRITTREGNGS